MILFVALDDKAQIFSWPLLLSRDYALATENPIIRHISSAVWSTTANQALIISLRL
jgi:hypothetical protein